MIVGYDLNRKVLHLIYISNFLKTLHKRLKPADTLPLFCYMLIFFPSQSGADIGDRRDHDVRADRGSAAVAHWGSDLLLQEDFRRVRSSGDPQSSQSSGSVSHQSFRGCITKLIDCIQH